MSNSVPPIKRTRRHVVIRMTPDQARAWHRVMGGLEAPARQVNRLRELATEADRLAQDDPAPKPQRTSIRPGDGPKLRLRKGQNQIRKGASV